MAKTRNLIKNYLKTESLISMTILKQLAVAIISSLLLATAGQAENLAQNQDAASREAELLLAISQQKWDLMAAKDADALEPIFHEASKFVHMSGTWKKARELQIIRDGSIWYKKTVIHDTDVEVLGNTAVVWSRITLDAHVRGNDVSNEFTVTEVFVKSNDHWQLLALTFSSVRDTHKIEH